MCDDQNMQSKEIVEHSIYKVESWKIFRTEGKCFAVFNFCSGCQVGELVSGHEGRELTGKHTSITLKEYTKKYQSILV